MFQRDVHRTRMKTNYCEPGFSSNEDDEEDAVPLTVVKTRISISSDVDSHSFKELYKYSMEQCELCEMIFHNRYDLMTHNSKHIIVPLLRYNIVKCTLCNKHFMTSQELETHISKHHNNTPNILNNFVLKQAIIKCDSTLTRFIKKANHEKEEEIKNDTTINRNIDILKTITEKEPLLKIDDTITKLIKANSDNIEINKEKTNNVNRNAKVEKEVKINVNGVENQNKKSVQSDIPVKEDNKMNFKSRLVFEEEFDFTNCTSINDDKAKQTEVLTLKAAPIMSNLNKNKGMNGTIQQLPGKIVLGSKSEQCEDVCLPPSVHYNELMKPGLFRCKRCGKSFPDRFQVITHETSHMKLKTRCRMKLCLLCDSYIAGGCRTLKNHMAKKHPSADISRHYKKDTCKTCGLKYHNLYRHNHRHHFVVTYSCKKCGSTFDSFDVLTEHKLKCSENEILEDVQECEKVNEEKSSIIKLCDLCLIFLRNSKYFKYKYIGEHSVMGERQCCFRCGKVFFEVKLVRRVHLNVERKKHNDMKYKSAPRNENRLKNIKQRMKMMNIMTRF